MCSEENTHFAVRHFPPLEATAMKILQSRPSLEKGNAEITDHTSF